ncbi:SGNH/GDSL hydrolase family protein [Streptomyces sp. NPDC006463]|uniref:SGNH/GDSL hydrolase family protein n=1 Tax=Streptomyces sp. NPDC006463 TaxID=3364746 RepID=UPI0036983B6F
MTTKTFALALPLAALVAATAASPAPAAHPAPWHSAWNASQQAPAHTTWYPNWSEGGFDNHSVRQTIRVGAEGSELRVRLSNAFGTTPLRLTGATVARSAGGAAVQPDTVRPLRFKGSGAATVPTGGELSSDPVALPVRAFEQLTVTFYFQGATGPATFHNVAMTTSYRATGDHLGDPAADAFSEAGFSWYYLAGVDVKNLRPGGPGGGRGAVVAFGDSLTDGYGATPGADRRYPDELAERLASQGRPRTVLNAGIGGNKVLGDSECFGESALARFRRDALGRPDVATVVVLEGTNDIVMPDGPADHCTTPSPEVTAAEIIAGHRQLIREARTRGVRVIGATIPPYHGFEHWTERGEKVRKAVNEWIRTSGAYDGVADFDRVLAAPVDPAHPEAVAIKQEYAFGDRIHLNDAGYRAMAEAVDLNSL